ncbi:tRNA uracil 4-sulfurtransferase ThiI [Methanolacinia petrolearia]|uniref:tRNA uracil 4-sulfurtransferase ThiI n=1 Tax=Methanolacinia petrolearia TaxID=54120 RepID=UPI003BAA2FDD
MKRAVMIRYGELFLKSEPVMRHYVGVLTANIKRALDAEEICHEITITRGRIFVYGEDVDAINSVLLRIFGIVGTSIVICTPPDRETIEKTAAIVASRTLKPGMSFAVRARRSNIKGFTSQELAASTGSCIYEAVGDLKVDLDNPEYEIFIEARSNGGFIYETRTPGPGGLPVGTQGKVLCLLSAGIDSPVAAWLAMSRGCIPGFIYFDGGDYFGKDTNRAVLENLQNLSRWYPGSTVEAAFIDITPFFDKLTDKSAKEALKNRCIICKRFMLRLAGKCALDWKYLGLVTGNSIGQVASQTLANIGILGSAVPEGIALIEPLITYDKEDTVKIARNIGTFRENAGDLSCGVVPSHPSIAATLAKVIEDEVILGIPELIEECIPRKTICKVKDGKLLD